MLRLTTNDGIGTISLLGLLFADYRGIKDGIHYF